MIGQVVGIQPTASRQERVHHASKSILVGCGLHEQVQEVDTSIWIGLVAVPHGLKTFFDQVIDLAVEEIYCSLGHFVFAGELLCDSPKGVASSPIEHCEHMH
jgi:hypothetical protein